MPIGFEYFLAYLVLCVVVGLIVVLTSSKNYSAQDERDAQTYRDTTQLMWRYRQEVRLEHERVRAEDMWRGKRD